MEQDNIYRAQYTNERKSELAYSDNGQIDNCDESNYMRQINRKESLYKKWLIQRGDLEQTYQKKLKDVLVRSGKNFVKYICKYKGNRKVLGAEIFKFKITLVYRSLEHKWYISQGYSFVPEVIDLKNKLKFGTYHPISEKVLIIINEIQRSIDAYMHRFAVVHQFIYNVRRSYKDMQFSINSNAITKIKLIFTENAWPSDIRKSNIRDTIVVELTLNKNIKVCSVTYEYIYVQASRNAKENIDKLKFKLENFYNFPLEMAFEKFMKEENCIDQESSESTIYRKLLL